MWVSFTTKGKETNKMGKRLLNYKVHENKLRQKEDHPKDPFDRYQWSTK